MADPKNPRLTAADRELIKAYAIAGITGVSIAKEIGCGDAQVHHYLSTFSPRLVPAPEVPVIRAQDFVIERFEASGLYIQEAATRLNVELGMLALELRGRKPMSSKRIQALKALLDSASAEV